MSTVIDIAAVRAAREAKVVTRSRMTDFELEAATIRFIAENATILEALFGFKKGALLRELNK